MAVADAERARKSRERMKEKLGVEGLREYDHEKYLLKKERALGKGNLKLLMNMSEIMQKLFREHDRETIKLMLQDGVPKERIMQYFRLTEKEYNRLAQRTHDEIDTE